MSLLCFLATISHPFLIGSNDCTCSYDNHIRSARMEIWCKPYLRFVQSHDILSFVDWQFDVSAAENSATSVSEDGGIRFFRNVANEIIAYTASHLRRASHM